MNPRGKPTSIYYAGFVFKDNGNKTYEIHFSDGDKSKDTPLSWIEGYANWEAQVAQYFLTITRFCGRQQQRRKRQPG